jgi:hypothetical protein
MLIHLSFQQGLQRIPEEIFEHVLNILRTFRLICTQQFLEKMINGGKQLEQNPSKHGGRHWRYFYGLYKEGKLNEEYDRVIGSRVFDRLQADGYIHEDHTMADFFKNLNK